MKWLNININPIVLVVLEILGAIVCAFVFFIKLLEKDKKIPRTRLFLVIAFLSIFGILLDELYLVFSTMGELESYILVIVYIRYVIGGIIIILIGEYSFYGLRKRLIIPRTVIFICFGIVLFILAINYFFGGFFTYSEGIFVRDKFYYYLILCYLFMNFVQIFMFIYSSIKIEKRIVKFAIFVAPQLLALACEFLINEYTVIFLSFAITCGAIYIVLVKDQVERMNQQEVDLYNANVALMLSQMQPHFLYNALSAIGEICLEDPQKASKAIDDFSFYLRGNLESIGANKMIPFNDELKHIKYYISLEEIRLEDRLSVEFDIKDSDFLVPTLCVQPIVENAIRHGLSKVKVGGKLTLSTFRKDGYVNIVVEDNGVGFDPTNIDISKHVGLDNVKKRVKSLVDGDVIIDSFIGKGTKITIKFRG